MPKACVHMGKVIHLLFPFADGSVQHQQLCVHCTGLSWQRVEPKGKAVDLPLKLRPNPHLLYSSDQKNEVADTSGANELPLQGGWAQP